jgi:hypothetical protein
MIFNAVEFKIENIYAITRIFKDLNKKYMKIVII